MGDLLELHRSLQEAPGANCTGSNCTCVPPLCFITPTGFEIHCTPHSWNISRVMHDGPQMSWSNLAGVAMAVGANFVIPLALNLQKLAHRRNADADGNPIKAVFKIPLWWIGILLMIGGECCNLLAYGYAPTALVAPVGAVGVFFNGVIATAFMKEPFGRRDALGLCLIASGVVMVVASVPEAQVDLTTEIVSKCAPAAARARAPSPPAPHPPPLPRYILPDPRCYGYFLVLFVIVPLYIYFALPRFAKRHVLCYLLLCSTISSVTVVSSRAFSSILTDSIGRGAWWDWISPVPFCAFLIIIVTAIWSTFYLNKAMQHFGNNEVVPVYYTTFTLASVSAGALVYSEFQCLMSPSVYVFLLGCATTFVGVYCVAGTDREGKGRGSPPPSHEMGGQEGRFNRLMEINPAQNGAAGGVARDPSGLPPPGEHIREGSSARNLRLDLPWGGMGEMGLSVPVRAQTSARSMMVSGLQGTGTLQVAVEATETISQVIHHIAPSLSSVGMRNRSDSSDANRSRGEQPLERARSSHDAAAHAAPRSVSDPPPLERATSTPSVSASSSGGDGIPFGVRPDDGGAGVGATPVPTPASPSVAPATPTGQPTQPSPPEASLPADTPMDAGDAGGGAAAPAPAMD